MNFLANLNTIINNKMILTVNYTHPFEKFSKLEKKKFIKQNNVIYGVG